MKSFKKEVVYITTIDGKTYQFPSDDSPKLWEVSFEINFVNDSGYVMRNDFGIPKARIYVERETLENAGVLPWAQQGGEPKERPETAEDLLYRLLEHLGFYPEQ